MNDSLKTCCSNFDDSSLTIDESADMKDTAQLAIFNRVTAALQVYEEFLQLVPLCGTTTGQNIFDAVLQCVKQQCLDLFRLVCVMADIAPAMTGERKGAASLLVRHCETTGNIQPIYKVHCITYHESLCSKSSSSLAALTTASARH